MTETTTPIVYAQVEHLNGAFFVYRRQGRKLSRERRQQSRPPRFRHPNYESAEAEAARLALLFPESTFVILAETAIVRQASVREPQVLDG